MSTHTSTEKVSDNQNVSIGFMKPIQPDTALAKIVGPNPLPRTEINKKVSAYIKKHKLQQGTTDAYGNSSSTLIKADELLEPVFNGKKEVDMFEVTRLVNSHIVQELLIMNSSHPQCGDFITDMGERPQCEGDLTETRKILGKYKCDIEKSLTFFKDNGGHCDCEVVLNVCHR